MIGMLITMACMVVLTAILMTSLNNVMTGAGNPRAGTVRSMKDQLNLSQIMQTMIAGAQERDGLPVPGALGPRREDSLNTTASLFSLLVMEDRLPADMLISGNEYNPVVQPIMDYDYAAYDPAAGLFWDRNFVADLKTGSNVSFAHMPLFGRRLATHWQRRAMDSRFPLMGNRGPRDGRPDPMSYTNGKDGIWGGHLAFGDGHVAFTNSLTPEGLFFQDRDGARPDNIFSIDDDRDHSDAVLTFTRSMDRTGPAIQHD